MKAAICGVAFLVSAMLSGDLHSQELKIGDRAPDLAFQTIPNGSYSPGFNKGNYLILDFWATWCAPCIATFPKLNALSRQFSSKGVLFASITNEDPDKVKRFFQVKKNIHLDVIQLFDQVQASDFPEGITNARFHVNLIPFTVIIGPSQTIEWVGSAHDLDAKIIEAVISKKIASPKSATSPGKQVDSSPLIMMPDTVTYSGFKISSAPASKPSRSIMLNTFPEKSAIRNRFSGSTVDFILAQYYRIPMKQVEVKGIESAYIPLVNYSISRDEGTTWDSLALVTSEVLSKKYNFTYRVKRIVTEVWKLQLMDTLSIIRNAAAFDDTNGKSSSGIYGDTVYAVNFRYSQLKDILDKFYTDRFFLINEQALSPSMARRLFDLEIPVNNWKGLRKQLGRYGISLKSETLPVTYLVLDFTGSGRRNDSKPKLE